MSANRDNLLNQVYFVRYGSEELPSSDSDRKIFFDELVSYRKTLVARGLETVSVAALRNWLLGTKRATPKRALAMSFLYGYLHWVETAKRVTFSLDNAAERERKLEQEYLLAFLNSFKSTGDEVADKQVLTEIAKQGLVEELRLDIPFVARVKRILLSAAHNKKRSDAHDLFEGGNRSSQAETSYYLAYRYSTNCGNVMKLFITIERPDANFRSFCSFYLFSRGLLRNNERGGKRIFRECEGIVLPFERAFYLVGYNYNVRVRTNVSQVGYQEFRQRARQHPDGLGVIAVEYEDIDRSNGLIGGLIMTMAGENQPIVARLALLHLGTKSSLGMNVWDHQVLPWEGPSEEAGRDLQMTLDRVRGLGCKDFGPAVTAALTGDAEAAGENLLRSVLNIIDNTPAWETASHNPSAAHRSDDFFARGALETYGMDRPRD